MIGIVVVDSDFNVTWASELFKERRLLIVDKNILAWKPEFTRLVELGEALSSEHDETIKVEIESRNYEVKYLSKAGIFLFKDITEFEYLFTTSIQNSPVLGLLVVDNYSDVILKWQKANVALNTTGTLINEYFSRFGVMVGNIAMTAYIFSRKPEKLR